MTTSPALRRAILPLLFSLVPLAACAPRPSTAGAPTPEPTPMDARRGLPPSDSLYREIAAVDGSLFAAYNGCDLAAFRAFFADDVEFYHDQGGLMVGADSVTEAVRKNICGKVRRTLVPGTLQVHPMRGYGALALGVHRFLQLRDGKWTEVGEAQFAHLLRRTADGWRITREISYDHRSLER